MRVDAVTKSIMSYHLPVLSKEVLFFISTERSGLIVDGTMGDGGHSEAILKNTNPKCRILGIDRDASALARAKKRLAVFGDRVTYAHGNFSDIKRILQEEGIMKVDGFLLDLGVSSPQIDVPGRGFSFMREGPLDMRMNREDKVTAADLLATYSDSELEFIIKTYGEERFYRKVVRKCPDAMIYRALSEVKDTDRMGKIKKSKGAYFTSLIQKYSEEQGITI